MPVFQQSLLGFIVGLGDRHPNNILFDERSLRDAKWLVAHKFAGNTSQQHDVSFPFNIP